MSKFWKDFRGVAANRDTRFKQSVPVQDPWGHLLDEIEERGLFDTLFPGPGDAIPPMSRWDPDSYLVCAHCGQRSRVPTLNKVKEDE